MKKFEPSFEQFIESEENILRSKLNAIRATIPHPYEKGHSFEYEVMHLIKNFLPSEYGVSTGFIVYHSNNCIEQDKDSGYYKYIKENDKILISNQLDIIIYDSIRGGPIVRLGSCDVFPIESVYAYIEIKTILTNFINNNISSFDKLFENNFNLRNLKTRFYWESDPNTYSNQSFLSVCVGFTPIKSFLFALDSDEKFKDSSQLINELENHNINKIAFFNGIYVQDKGFFKSILDNKNISIKLIDDKKSLLEFKKTLYSELSSFIRVGKHLAPAIDTYFNQTKPKKYYHETGFGMVQQT